MNTYQLAQETSVQEQTVIKKILKDYEYQQQIAYQNQKHKLPLTNASRETQKTKWVTFTYYGPGTRIITKLF
jgi:hypothetical protein